MHDAAEIGRQFKGLTAEEAARARTDALIGLGSKANQAFTDMHDSALAAGNALGNMLLPQLYRRVAAAIRAICRACRAYLPEQVCQGERPEAPSLPAVRTWSESAGQRFSCLASPGRWRRTRDIPTADEIGAAVVAALHPLVVPLVTDVPQDAVTDSILRRTPNRQALRGWA